MSQGDISYYDQQVAAHAPKETVVYSRQEEVEVLKEELAEQDRKKLSFGLPESITLYNDGNLFQPDGITEVH